jgi:hypothetical protein
LIWEIVALFAVSLGMSGVRSLVSLTGSLTEPESLGAQHIAINGSQAPHGRAGLHPARVTRPAPGSCMLQA